MKSFRVYKTTKTFFFVCCGLFFLNVPNWLNAQQWTKATTISTPEKEAIGALVADPLGNTYLSGTFDQSISLGNQTIQSQGLDDVFLSKYTPDLNVEWMVAGGGENFDQASALAIDSDQNILWGGQFWIEGTFGDLTLPLVYDSRGIFLIKYDPEGELLWGRSIEGKGLKILTDIDTDDQNNIYLSGYFDQTLILPDTILEASGLQNMFVIKLNEQGIIQWGRSAGYFGEVRAKGLAVWEDRVFVGGDLLGRAAFGTDSIRTNTQDHDVFIAAYDTSGSILWGRKAGGVHEDYGEAVEVDAAGNAYLTGTFFGVMKLSETIIIQTEGFNDNFFLCAYSPEGEALMGRSLGGTSDEEGTDLQIFDDQIFISGNYFDTIRIENFFLQGYPNQFNAFVAAFDQMGNPLWLEGATSSEYIQGNLLAVPDKNRIQLAGNFSSTATLGHIPLTGEGFNEIFLAEINPDLTSSISETQARPQLPIQVFPNPGPGLFQFSWEPPLNQQRLQLQIVDTRGSIQALLPISSGQNSVAWNAEQYASGLYFFQLLGETGILGSGKLMLRK